MGAVRRFLTGDRGQDLVEYVLLLALAVIATTAMLMTAGESLSAVWNAPVLGTSGPPQSSETGKH